MLIAEVGGAARGRSVPRGYLIVSINHRMIMITLFYGYNTAALQNLYSSYVSRPDFSPCFVKTVFKQNNRLFEFVAELIDNM